MRRSFTLAALLLLATMTGAQAHVGAGGTGGFMHGVGHPFGGLDHILAMVAVGVMAAHLGGRALWLVPAAFIAMMAAGGVAGTAGVHLPFVETAIALSVVVLGLTVALRLAMASWAAMALAGFFAVFHGHSHGAEMPETMSGLAYGAGFVLATAALHTAGIALGLAVDRLDGATGRRIAQAAGGAMAAAGVALLAGIA